MISESSLISILNLFAIANNIFKVGTLPLLSKLLIVAWVQIS